MYYVPDGTKECGYYECKKCGNRFLSMQTMKRIPCPDCEAEIDYEIGPDESLEDVLDTAELIQKIDLAEWDFEVNLTREALVKIERGIQHIKVSQLKAIKVILETTYDELLK